VRILVETSPLAILTLDHNGTVALANESARELFGFEDESLPGTDIAPYLPILYRMLNNPRSAAICALMWNAKRSAAMARSSWLMSGSPRITLHAARDSQPWSGTPARTCATARVRASTP
jgi:PAS domain-containing protein